MRQPRKLPGQRKPRCNERTWLRLVLDFRHGGNRLYIPAIFRSINTGREMLFSFQANYNHQTFQLLGLPASWLHLPEIQPLIRDMEGLRCELEVVWPHQIYTHPAVSFSSRRHGSQPIGRTSIPSPTGGPAAHHYHQDYLCCETYCPRNIPRWGGGWLSQRITRAKNVGGGRQRLWPSISRDFLSRSERANDKNNMNVIKATSCRGWRAQLLN